MSDHLPECLVPDFDKGTWVCICEPLRACEQRKDFECLSKSENRSRWREEGVNAGYSAGLQAARKAVQRVGIQPEPVQQYTKSLAAIDALGSTNP